MTIRVRARGLILDRRDDSEDPLPAAIAINAEAVRPVQACQGLRLRVTGVAGLALLVDDVADFARIGRVADTSLLVKHAYPHHAGLVADRFHDLVQAFAIVVHHVVAGAALDHVADPLGAAQNGGFQMLAMQPDVEITQQAKNRHQCQQQQRDELGAQAVAQAGPAPQVLASWLNLRHDSKQDWLPSPALVPALRCVRSQPGRSADTS